MSTKRRRRSRPKLNKQLTEQLMAGAVRVVAQSLDETFLPGCCAGCGERIVIVQPPGVNFDEIVHKCETCGASAPWKVWRSTYKALWADDTRVVTVEDELTLVRALARVLSDHDQEGARRAARALLDERARRLARDAKEDGK